MRHSYHLIVTEFVNRLKVMFSHRIVKSLLTGILSNHILQLMLLGYLTIMYQSQGPYQICQAPRAVTHKGFSNLISPE